MPTIDERCYGHEPAASELKKLRSQIGQLKAKLRKAERGHTIEREARHKWELHAKKLMEENP